jgi:hypothetical protein
MNKHIWTCYIAGALLTLLYKLSRYIYQNKTRPLREVLQEWFFEKSSENAVSWATTFGAVWVIGSVYINQIGLFEWKVPLPLDNGIAFFLGSLMEGLAPNLTKWLTRKITEKFQGLQGDK